MSGTAAEWVGIAFMVASVIVSIVRAEMRANQTAEDMRGVKKALGLVPGEDATVVLEKPHAVEHTAINERLKKLGERTHDHGNQLANHEGRIASLEQGR